MKTEKQINLKIKLVKTQKRFQDITKNDKELGLFLFQVIITDF